MYFLVQQRRETYSLTSLHSGARDADMIDTRQGKEHAGWTLKVVFAWYLPKALLMASGVAFVCG